MNPEALDQTVQRVRADCDDPIKATVLPPRVVLLKRDDALALADAVGELRDTAETYRQTLAANEAYCLEMSAKLAATQQALRNRQWFAEFVRGMKIVIEDDADLAIWDGWNQGLDTVAAEIEDESPNGEFTIALREALAGAASPAGEEKK